MIQIKIEPGAFERIDGRLADLIERGRSNGITLDVRRTDTGLAGGFSGKISGTFTLTRSLATVDITKKPLFATEGMIRSKLAELFQ